MTNTVNESSAPGSPTESCRPHRCSAISAHSSVTGTPTRIREWLTQLPPDSRASRSVLPADGQDLPTIETCGQKRSIPFAEYDPDSFIWRTFQLCLLTHTPTQFSATWPRAGTIVDGVAYLRPKWEHPILDIGGGALPTPAAQVYGTNQSPTPGAAVRPSLETMARKGLWPTPTVQDAHNNAGASQYERKAVPLNAQVGGPLNPNWVEWLMGWPIGWTDLDPLAMDKFLKWCEQHGNC